MRGTEGYTGRYVWKLSVLFGLGRRRRGAAAPCIHWEDPVLNMASGVCKAFIRGALESDWFWNKRSQAPAGLTSKDGACLEWLAASNKHLKLPHAFPVFLLSHLKCQVFYVKSVWACTWHPRMWNASLGFKCLCVCVWGGSPLCLHTCFGRGLSIKLYETPSLPSPFTLSW